MEEVPIERQRSLLRQTVSQDPLAADLRLSLFVSAARSFRYDSCLQPFPPDFIVNGEKNIDHLYSVLETIPAVAELTASALETLDEKATRLLHWILCRQPHPLLRIVPKSQHEEVLAKCPCHAKYQSPSQIFEVTHRPHQSAERSFRENAVHFRTRHAYHGSRLFNFHSILQYGLQQHLNKVSMFGEGIYLSAELHVSQMFATNGSGWNRSALGTHLSCVALCEYVDNPNYVVSQEETSAIDESAIPLPASAGVSATLTGNGSLPERYILIKNNEMVQVRYLLLYGTSKEAKTDPNGGQRAAIPGPVLFPLQPAFLQRPPSRFVQWIADNKGIVLIGGYVGLLLIVGFINSRNAHYVKEMFLQKLNHVYNAVLSFRPDGE
ncbi:protein mono-ADP-ribosyltransferase PARP16-like [Anopheles cruzii]|uniref:protein mono-ADP-ribosyltransferase PARP16-like n=1 Tax=Anopheles cruzii TaxID=68878 RepID=UPI0022EC8237|nr:protein mono-ADP-ribosyltransferase PARP16-like [Anopheles cruzii]